MCGIAGFAGRGTRRDLELMTEALRHRGPDGDGFHIEEEEGERVFLGHRRLAILDLAGGHQPMWNEDGSVGVVFNGEIYNHSELRAELARCGHRFATHHSDTEILVHGYEEWGDRLPYRLNGMFAFAVYDRPRRRLFLARDRFGEKPLYYAERRGLFAFASELTALALHRDVGRSMNGRALQKFFAYGYLPAPHAFLEGTQKLPGGHWLIHDLATGRTETRPYWQFTIEADESLSDADEPRLVEECAALLTEAVRRRLMSDVDLGVFLSGGLDSSSVLGSLASLVPGAAIKTFTIGFTEPSFDESPYAEMVARHYGTRHYVRLLELDRARDLMPEVLSRLDEPLGDASILPTHLLSALAREKVTVALSGDGGDELFAGYDPFVALRPARIYSRWVPASIHRGVRRLVDLLPVSHANMSFDFKLRRSLMGLSYPELAWLPVWMSPIDPKDMAELFDTPVRLDDVYDEAIGLWERNPNKPMLDRALEFFTQFYLQDDILMKVDRAAMMCSLETRAVFLDNDLVEFCRRLPNRFKFRNGERKYLLKKVARRLLPAVIVDRTKKGFGIPLGRWLKEVPAEPPILPVRGMSSAYASRMFDEHRSGRRDHRLFMWSWLSVQSFAERLAGFTLAADDRRRTGGSPHVAEGRMTLET